MRLCVQVPATSANLGCGFDVFGLALTLYTDFEFDTSAEPGLEVQGDGAAALLAEGCGLLYESVRAFEAASGEKVPPFRLRVTNRIPLGRGLGSSSAAIIGGLCGANALCDEPLTQGEILNLANAIEGHPDNVAPALYGGLVLAICPPPPTPGNTHGHDPASATNDPIIVKVPMPDELTAVLYVPDFEMSTKAARAVLPKEVSLSDAVHNLSRTALLIAALYTPEKRFNLLREAMDDRLHQPYRTQIFPPLPHLIRAANNAGAYGTAMSGAGSSVLALVHQDCVHAVSAAFEAEAERHNLSGTVHLLQVAVNGALIEKECS